MKKIILLICSLSLLSATAHAFGYRFNLLYDQKIIATGGIITYVDSTGTNSRSTFAYPNGYTVHTFLSSQNLVSNKLIKNVEYLVVGGGGGGGGYIGAGGGGGGVFTNIGSPINMTQLSNAIYVASVVAPATDGDYSSFISKIAYGGKAGIVYVTGSGGKSGATTEGTLVYNGGVGTGEGDLWYSGGGAGAGANGMNGASEGNGGIGLQSSISGSPKYYGGGGGAGSVYGGYSSGGQGGGGNGGKYDWTGSVYQGGTTDGTINTGGGGGGGYAALGAGGSGIVIIRYPSNQ